MGAVVPSISDRGWVTSLPERCDLLLSYFFETDKIQTYLYPGKVSNLQGLLQQYGNNIPQLCIQLQAMLEAFFTAYFDAAVVNITANNDPTVNPTNKITVTIEATVNDNGKDYSFGEEVQISNSSFQRVMSIINTGINPGTTGGIPS